MDPLGIRSALKSEAHISTAEVFLNSEKNAKNGLIAESVRGFASIIGQEHAIGILTAFLREGNIPHALLFTGIRGIGKRSTARRFAMACNCETRARVLNSEDLCALPCGECRSCRRIESEIHPDILQILPGGGMIRITQIRELAATLTMKPYEATLRVVVISDAQMMNAEAGNALLKILEEPPDRTILILTTEQAGDLLPTIVSRCQQVRFKPIPRDRLETILKDGHGVSLQEAETIAALAYGSCSRAIEMSRPGWRSKRRWLIGQLASLSDQPVGALLALAEKLSTHRETLNDMLDVMACWLRDLILYRYRPEAIINRDLGDMIRARPPAESTGALMAKIEAVQRARKDIHANANPRLAMETLIIRLAAPTPSGG